MRWSFILFLPAAVTFLWPVAVMFKKSVSRAQVVLCLVMAMLGFAMSMMAVFFRGRAGSLFIYDYIFELTAMLCGPMFYVGVCSLTEPRGPSLRQRRVFVVPLLFAAALTVGAFWLGPRQYELLCHQLRDGEAAFGNGAAWDFMLLWDHYVFNLLLIFANALLMLASTRRLVAFQRRYNGLYAHSIGGKPINVRPAIVMSWLIVPLGLTMVAMVDFRPPYFKYYLIFFSLVQTVLQFFIGRFVYSLNHDARHLASIVK